MSATFSNAADFFSSRCFTRRCLYLLKVIQVSVLLLLLVRSENPRTIATAWLQQELPGQVAQSWGVGGTLKKLLAD